MQKHCVLRDWRKRAVPGADKNAPRGLLTTSTLAAMPRCKNIEFSRVRRKRGVPGANKKEPKTPPTTTDHVDATIA